MIDKPPIRLYLHDYCALYIYFTCLLTKFANFLLDQNLVHYMTLCIMRTYARRASAVCLRVHVIWSVGGKLAAAAAA